MRRRHSAVLLAAMLFTALPALAGEYYEKIKEKRLGEPKDGFALVYVIRPATVGIGVKFWAFADDQFLGVMRGREYTFAHVRPGRRLLWLKAENVSVLEMEVEAGKIYYVKEGIRMGALKARARISVLDEAEAKEALEKCDYTVPTEEGRRAAAEIVADQLAKAREKAAKKAQEKEEGD